MTSWERYQQHVLAELRRLAGTLNNVQENVTDLKLDVARLQVRAGLWGAAAGLLAALAGYIMR